MSTIINDLNEISHQAYEKERQQNCMPQNKEPVPLHDRVILQPLPVESVSTGGIIIPDTAKEKPQRGKILYVGKGVRDEEMTVKVNDTVLYGKHAGQPIIIDGKDCLIMRESDIMMII